MIDRVGQQLGNYRLVRLLGHGGFADVYLGEHVYLQSKAALKLLHSRLSGEEAACFVTEARTLARLTHPHIVRVLDFAVHEGLPFLVMEYAPGGTLRMRHPAGTRLPLATIVSYVSQVASALQYAHDQQLIHRDVKPENMLLGAREEVLLADFGLAMLAPASSRSTQAMEPPLNGTTAYLAPEQLQGKPRPASDQYALGVVVYEWLCGRRLFGGSPIKIAMQQLSMPPASLREQVPDLPPAVEEVVLRALAKEPRLRFACVQDFANAFQQAAQHAESPVVASGAAAEVPHSARAAAGPPAALAQEQADAWAVMTPNAVAALQVERGQQETPADTAPPGPLWNVPTSLTPLVGREQDAAAACALLSRPEVRLVTLLGAGGIGKTRLAMQVAMQMRERYADGVCFVALAPISDPKLTISTIAHTLGIQQGGMQTLLEAVQAWLRDKQLLLLLDNFEQIVTAAPLLEGLLAGCPKLTIVVTSREALHLQAEHLFPVPPLALRLGGALREFWSGREQLREGLYFLMQALERSTGAVSPARAKALIAAAHMAIDLGYLDQGEELAKEGQRLCQALGDARSQALSLHMVQMVARLKGDYRMARSLAEEALALFQGIGDRKNAAWSHFRLARLARAQGEYARACALFEENVAMHRQLGNKEGTSFALMHWAEALFVSQGDLGKVRALLDEGVALIRELGYMDGISVFLNLSAQIALSQGDIATAHLLAEEQAALGRETGDQEGVAEALFVLGKAAAASRDYAGAYAQYEESLALFRTMGNKMQSAFCLEGLASVVAAQGDPTWAARLWGAAESLREAIGSPLPPIERADYEHAVAAARGQLGEHAFAVVWAVGRAMTLEQVLVARGSPVMPKPNQVESSPAHMAKASPTSPAGLTAREVEVLRLVVQGLTDAQVAEQLVISPRTVNWHLTAIYSKLQVTSRSAATRYALEHHLV